MKAPALAVTGLGALTSIGVGVRQTDAALRLGLSRFRDGMRTPLALPPATVALVEDDTLEARYHAAWPLVRAAWPARLAALAGPALAEATTGLDPATKLVVMLGLPDPTDAAPLPLPAVIWTMLSATSGRNIDHARSRTFTRGRAAMFDALAAARAELVRDPAAVVVCGGVDSYADPERVEHERRAERTRGEDGPGDGRVLGEAAAFLRLALADPRRPPPIELADSSVVVDPGHRFGTEPERGEGLANALQVLRDAHEPGPFGSVWAAMTGELHDAKLWGVAALRHRDLLPVRVPLDHPADRIGDAGAGLGALLFVVAHEMLRTGRRRGPALLWAASDRGPCGCAVLRPSRSPS